MKLLPSFLDPVLGFRPLGSRRRRTWSRPGRAHIEVRGVQARGSAAVIATLERELGAVAGVEWARVNPVLARVIVAFDGDQVDPDDLVGVVDGLEEASGVDAGDLPADLPEHPGDAEPIHRALIGMAADAAGITFGAVGSLLRLPRLPVEAASATSLIEFFPPIRAALERRPPVEAAVAVANAVLQGLGQGPLGLVVDGAHRAGMRAELVARRRAWERAEPELHPGPGHPADADDDDSIDPGPRPVALPDGPVERYGRVASLGALGAGGAVLATTADPRRAAGVVLAGIPRAARLGRESFAAHTDRLLSGRGLIAMDPRVLRRLDRIDTLVLDEEQATGDDGDAAALVDRARDAGLEVVLAGSGRAAPFEVDATVPGGRDLTGAVRRLQADGRVVALVSARSSALRAADCGIGVLGSPGGPPWGAHLLASDLATAASAVQACRLARTASRQSVAVATVGSGLGAVLALNPGPGSGPRTMTAAHISTLAAMGVGAWTALQLPAAPPPRPSPIPWHALDAGEVLARLDSGRDGLADDVASTRRAPVARPGTPVLLNVLGSELANPLTAILGAGAGLSAAVGSLVDATLVGGVLVLNAVVGTVQRLRTEEAVAELTSAVTAGTVRVLRGGQEREIDNADLVPGDVVLLEAGEALAADARLLDAVGLETDESALTGESVPVPKDTDPAAESSPVAERHSMVFAGTAVAAGRGRAVVVATGGEVEARRGVDRDRRPPPTGVEVRLRSLTDRTLPLVAAASGGLTVNGLLRGQPLRAAVSSGVSLAAAAVPEGLPFVATVAQAGAARRLSREGILVRNPRVLEALGRVDVLCFDKTGTLTEGRLHLQLVSDGQADEPVGSLSASHRQVLAAALRATPRARNNHALPHPTDQAVIEGATEAGVTLQEGIPGWGKAGSLPFEPGRGYHAVIGDSERGQILSVKGAPEVILPRCRAWRRSEDRVEPMGPEEQRRLEGEVERLARMGLRVLAVAERSASGRQDLDDSRVDNLELHGFVGVADAARSSAIAPIRQMAAAGIRVVMVTGDHPSTAEAVAAELGLLNGGRVLTGPDIESLDDADLEKVVDEVAVFARVAPADKVRIVRAFQGGGRIVAMTGDGANDAQAIRLANIGIAFGPGATAAAREAADLVVVDDRVETVIQSIAEGRAMWASVRNALAILLGGNLGEVAFTTGAALLTGRPPLTARQLLAVNLFTDLAPAMAIAVQPPRERRVDLAREGPDTSLSGPLVRDMLIRAAATAGGAAAAWTAASLTGTPARARTVALASLVGAQLGQTLVLGYRSPLVVGSTLVSAAGLAAVIHTPGVNRFFDCRPLGPVGWGLALGSAGLATAAAVVADRLVTDGASGAARSGRGGGHESGEQPVEQPHHRELDQGR